MDRRDRPDRSDSPDRPDPHRAESTAENDTDECSPLDGDVEIMGAYDDIDGTPVFVIAALDCEGAWMAAEGGCELDPADWR